MYKQSVTPEIENRKEKLLYVNWAFLLYIYMDKDILPGAKILGESICHHFLYVMITSGMQNVLWDTVFILYIYIYIYIYIMDLVVRGIWQHIYYAEGWYIIPRGNILSNSLSGGSINTIGKTSKHSDGKTSKTEAKQAIILMAKQLFLVLSLLTASFWYSCKLISLLCRGNTL